MHMFKNKWLYAPAPLYAFMAWTGITTALTFMHMFKNKWLYAPAPLYAFMTWTGITTALTFMHMFNPSKIQLFKQ